MALKQGHKAVEMAAKETKMGWNHDSDREKCTWNTDSNMASSSMRKMKARDIPEAPKKPLNW